MFVPLMAITETEYPPFSGVYKYLFNIQFPYSAPGVLHEQEFGRFSTLS
jgi:hypothetical protein